MSTEQADQLLEELRNIRFALEAIFQAIRGS